MPRLAILVLVSGSVLLGCGPTQSTSLIMDADNQLEAAKSADAQKLAPYEYTAADAYLHKAREEQGYADYEVSIGFAQKALDFAKQAKEISLQKVKEGSEPGGGTLTTPTTNP